MPKEKKEEVTKWCGLVDCKHTDQIKSNDYTVSIIEICKEGKKWTEISCKRI